MKLPLQITPRLATPRWLAAMLPVLSLLLSLAVGALFLWAAGGNPIDAYTQMFQAGFGSIFALSDTLVKATPLILCGLGAAVAFRARLWNIGGEGQLLIGAWAATGVALHFPSTLPAWVMLPCAALAGALAGALWAGICGALRILRDVSELLSSLMFNYIAILWVRYFVFGPWSEASFPLSRAFPKNAWLPRLFPSLSGVTIHAGLIVAFIAAALLALLLARTRFGFALRVIGSNPRAALQGGLAVRRDMLIVLFLSGSLAGLAGMVEVSGVIHRLSDRFSPGYGFTAIIVAWLAKLDPLAVVPVSILLAGILVGGKVIQPAGIPQMLQGVILLVVVGVELVSRYRVTLRRSTP